MQDDLFDTTYIERPRIWFGPQQGTETEVVILEDEPEPIMTHWLPASRQRRPHLREGCPYCTAADDEPLKPFWPVGGVLCRQLRIYLMPETSHRSCHGIDATKNWKGLRVVIGRKNYVGSPQVLRVAGLVSQVAPWIFNTRLELCRLWNIKVSPRVYREDVG